MKVTADTTCNTERRAKRHRASPPQRARTAWTWAPCRASIRSIVVLSEEYVVIDGAPQPEVAVDIRREAGLSPRTLEQTSLALEGSWAAVHVVHVDTAAVVAMGRVIGDGGWYFHIADMAVLPDHQRRGIGTAVLTRLVERIGIYAPPGAYITLLADAPGRPLYRSHGFVETAPDSIGMVLGTGPRTIAAATAPRTCEPNRRNDDAERLATPRRWRARSAVCACSNQHGSPDSATSP